jgi:MFS family permease
MMLTPSDSHRRYALGIMTAVYTLNLVDRGLVAVLLQPIKEDMHLSDTQLGLMTGIVFAAFYATFGIPIARWADRGDRVTITALAIAVWGLTVMSCLLVTNYIQLLLARMASAIGESGCKPPTYSLIGDWYPRPAERTGAMTIYWLGGSVATLVSFAVGGLLNEAYGWRLTFFLMGLPGLVLAVIVRLSLVDPRISPSPADHQELPPLRSVLTTLWRRKSMRHLTLALILLYTLGSGLSPWYTAFMIRSHQMGTGEVGVWLGVIFGVGGVLGVIIGGYVATRWLSNSEKSQMRISAITVGLQVPCLFIFVMVEQKQHALIALAPVIVLFSFFMGPTYALMQRLVPDKMRATVLAVVMFLVNLIGMGVGPQIVGILSDVLAPVAGIDSLRYAMLIVSFTALWSAYHFWRASGTIGNDLLEVSAEAHLTANCYRRELPKVVY